MESTSTQVVGVIEVESDRWDDLLSMLVGEGVVKESGSQPVNRLRNLFRPSMSADEMTADLTTLYSELELEFVEVTGRTS